MTLPLGVTPAAVTLTVTLAFLPRLTFFLASFAVTFASALATAAVGLLVIDRIV